MPSRRQYRRSHSLSPRHHLLLAKIAARDELPLSKVLEQLVEREAHGHVIDVTDEEIAAFKAEIDHAKGG